MKPTGRIEIFGLLGVLFAATALASVAAALAPALPPSRAPLPAPAPSLGSFLGVALRQALTDLDELCFLPPELFLVALSSYFRTLRELGAFSDELLLILRRFLYEFGGVNEQLRFLPHLPRRVLKRNLSAQLALFAQQFEKPGDSPAFLSPEELRRLVPDPLVVRIKDSYTEDYLVTHRPLFQRLAEALLTSRTTDDELLTKDRLRRRIWTGLDRFEFLELINRAQLTLFGGLLEGLVLSHPSPPADPVSLSAVRNTLAVFLENLSQKSYLAQRIQALNTLSLANSRSALSNQYEGLWTDPPESFFPEKRDWYTAILQNGLSRAADDSFESLVDAHEAARLGLAPPLNERNLVFKSFHLFANSLGFTLPASMDRVLMVYTDALGPLRVVSKEAISDLKKTVAELAEMQLRQRTLERTAVHSVLEAHGLVTLLPHRRSSAMTPLRSLFASSSQPLGTGSRPVSRCLEDTVWTYPLTEQTKIKPKDQYGNGSAALDTSLDFLTQLRKVTKVFHGKEARTPFNLGEMRDSLFHLKAVHRLVRPFSSITGLFKLRVVLGAYIENLNLNDMLPRRQTYLLFTLLKRLITGYITRKRFAVGAVIQRLRDRSQEVPAVSLNVKASSSFARGSGKCRSSAELAKLIMQRVGGTSKKTEKKIIEKECFGDHSGTQKGGAPVAFGRTRTFKALPVINKDAGIASFIQQRFPFKKNLQTRFELTLKKMRDHFFRAHSGLLKVSSQLWFDRHHSQATDGSDGFDQKGRLQVALGKTRSIPVSPVIDTNARLVSFILQRVPLAHAQSLQAELTLKKSRDRTFRAYSGLLKTTEQSSFSRHGSGAPGELPGRPSTHETLTAFGRTGDSSLVSPLYGLAVLTCFEQHYRDVSFTSWNDLQSAMKQYLDKVGGLDLSPAELSKVKKTLPFLRPFFRYSNFEYHRLFAPFQTKGQVKLPESFQDADLLEGAVAFTRANAKTGRPTTPKFLARKLVDMAGSFLVSEEKNAFVGLQKKQVVEQMEAVLTDVFTAVQISKDPKDALVDVEKGVVEEMTKSPVPEERLTTLTSKLFAVHLLKTKMRAIIDLKRQLFTFERLSPKTFPAMREFFAENELLLEQVLGGSLRAELTRLLDFLAAPTQQALKASELLAATLGDRLTKIALIFAQDGQPDGVFNWAYLQVLRHLFREFPQRLLLLDGVAFFEVSSEVREAMAFCARESTAISATIDKIRSRQFWRRSTVQAIRSVVFPKVQRLSGKQKMLMHLARFRDHSHELHPFTHLVVAHALHKAANNLVFKSGGQFRRFVGRIVNRLDAKNTPNHGTGKVLASLYGDKSFLVKNRFSLNRLIGRINMRLFNGRLVTTVQKLAVENGVAMPVHFGKNRNYRAFARIKQKVLVPLIEGIHLRKDLLGLFGTNFLRAYSRTRAFLGRLKRVRVKYLSKNLAEAQMKRLEKPPFTVSVPLGLRKYWASKHFRRDVFRLSSLSHHRIAAAFLRDTQSSGNESQYFSRTKLKPVLKLLLDKSSYRRVRLPLVSVSTPSPGFRPLSKLRFKQVLRPLNEKLKALRSVLSHSLYKSLRNNVNSQRVFFKMLDSSPQRLAISRRINAYLRKHTLLFNPGALRGFRARFKALDLINIQRKFLNFVRRVKGAAVLRKIKRLRRVPLGRVRFKHLVSAIEPPGFAKMAKIKRNVHAWRESRFREFLRDFKRMYTETSIAGKRVEPQSIVAEFVKRVMGLRHGLRRKPREFGKLSNPNIGEPGKRVLPPPPQTVFCRCECCIDFSGCGDSSNCDCDNLKVKATLNPNFISKADKMVNLSPVINFHLNVRDTRQGGYREFTAINFRGGQFVPPHNAERRDAALSSLDKLRV